MAGKKQQAPKPIDEEAEEAEGEGWDNVADVDSDGGDEAGQRMRDWRDVEKYREMRELRRLVGDEFDFTDVLGEIPIRTRHGARGNGRGKPAAQQKGKVTAGTKAPPPAPAQKNKSQMPQVKGRPAASAHKPAPAVGSTRAKAAIAASKPPANAHKSQAAPKAAANVPKGRPRPAARPKAAAPARKAAKPARPAAKRKARKR